MQEFIAHSWYEYAGGDDDGAASLGRRDEAQVHRPQAALRAPDVDGKYSWLKTPRWKGQPMEVGPLARLLVAYAAGSEEVKEVVDASAASAGRAGHRALLDARAAPPPAGSRRCSIARWAKEFYGQLLANIKNGDTRTFDNGEVGPGDLAGRGQGRRA